MCPQYASRARRVPSSRRKTTSSSPKYRLVTSCPAAKSVDQPIWNHPEGFIISDDTRFIAVGYIPAGLNNQGGRCPSAEGGGPRVATPRAGARGTADHRPRRPGSRDHPRRGRGVRVVDGSAQALLRRKG